MKRAVNLGTPFSPIISQPYLCPKKGKKHPKPVKRLRTFLMKGGITNNFTA